MSDTLGFNTAVSGQGSLTTDPSGQSSAGVNASASPGAQGPGGNMTVAHACILVIAASAASLFAIGFLFRRPVGKA